MEGTYQQHHDIWLRLFDNAGRLLPTEAEAERQRADVERQRADAAEAEAANLRAELARLRQTMNRQE